jgi:hypothetical protein
LVASSIAGVVPQMPPPLYPHPLAGFCPVQGPLFGGTMKVRQSTEPVVAFIATMLPRNVQHG